MRVVALVPRRAGDPQRDRVWAWLRARWKTDHPDWPVFEGHHDGPGSFNRSAAINTAADAAGSWDVAVIADADCLVDPRALERAVTRAAVTGRMVIAYERWAGLDRHMTDRILTGYDGSWESGIALEMLGTCSAMITVPWGLWLEVGGFDERFEGWGMEDVAFSLACATLAGREREPGTVWHLWHRSQPRRPDEDRANAELMERYRVASDDRAAMVALCAEALAVTS